MTREKPVRSPKQARSQQMRQKILDTAYALFCEKGYYGTTTNEIAKTAGISIGSLYSYFQDKDTIFMEILEYYHGLFLAENERMKRKLQSVKPDFRQWLREMIEGLIKLHDDGKILNQEVKILCYTNPDFAALEERHMRETRRVAMECIQLELDEIGYDDVEAAGIVAYDFTSAVVDRVVFGEDGIDRERIIRAGVEALYRFLAGSKEC